MCEAVEFIVEGNCNVIADQTLLSVFDNIISNAINYGNASRISIKVQNENYQCIISVADNGAGIPDEIKPQIFEKGFKYGKTGKTGIGLFIVKKTIERYNGSIDVENNVPCGVKFIVTLDSV